MPIIYIIGAQIIIYEKCLTKHPFKTGCFGLGYHVYTKNIDIYNIYIYREQEREQPLFLFMNFHQLKPLPTIQKKKTSSCPTKSANYVPTVDGRNPANQLIW